MMKIRLSDAIIDIMSVCIGCVGAVRSIRINNLGLIAEAIARMLRPYKHTQPLSDNDLILNAEELFLELDRQDEENWKE